MAKNKSSYTHMHLQTSGCNKYTCWLQNMHTLHVCNTRCTVSSIQSMTFTSTGVMARPQDAHFGANKLRAHTDSTLT